MLILYRFGIFVYGFLLKCLQYINPKAKLFVQGRKRIFEHLASLNPNRESHIWFHFASLGEFEQGRPVLTALKKLQPTCKIAVSFFSPSGYEIRKNTPLADLVCYLPLDTPTNARKFVEIIHPSKVYFTKYEFWHFYISECNRNKIPLYLISGIFRKEQLFFKSYGGFFRKMLQKFDYLFVQNQQSLHLLQSIGIKQCSISGDTRFDTVLENALHAKKIPWAEKFANHQFCIVAGSTWPEDETILITYLQQNPSIKCIIAPHEINQAHLDALKKRLRPISFVLYSKIEEKTLADVQVLVIDNIGMLSSLYQYAQITYVGGGFGKGIHNTLEAIAFGAPVIFGPKFQKFAEASALITASIGKSIQNNTEFAKAVDFFKSESEISLKTMAFIQENKGATEKIMRATFNYVNT